MAISFRRFVALIGTLSMLPVVAAAQESATITGRIMGEGSTQLSGVTVSIPELGIGATSRDGMYSIFVPASRVTRQAVTVTARRVGYKPKSARVTHSQAVLVFSVPTEVPMRSSRPTPA